MKIKIVSKLTDKSKKLKLVVVTKNRSVEQIMDLNTKIPFKRLAENRLNEAVEKFKKLPPNLEKHFIGKLQSRKIKDIILHFDVIQSLENSKQAQRISEAAKSLNKAPYPVFLQINISGKQERSGCHPDDAKVLIQELHSNPDLKLLGVMGMASDSNGSELIKKEFITLKSFQGDLQECSMGMSSDYKTAIECGTTMLRLGSALFKEPLPDLPEFD